MSNTFDTAAAPTPQIIELSELPPQSSRGESILNGNLNVVQNVKAKLTVVAGEATISVGELLNMKANQVFKLDSLTDDPVDILLEGNLVARGQLVAVDDNFGVQITELPKV